ncbi:transcriptional regulator, partial [Limosilactobacillus reuteri]
VYDSIGRVYDNPNVENRVCKKAIEKLYLGAYTSKMSKKGTYQIPEYFDLLVPPLELLLWQDCITVIDYANK